MRTSARALNMFVIVGLWCAWSDDGTRCLLRLRSMEAFLKQMADVFSSLECPPQTESDRISMYSVPAFSGSTGPTLLMITTCFLFKRQTRIYAATVWDSWLKRSRADYHEIGMLMRS